MSLIATCFGTTMLVIGKCFFFFPEVAFLCDLLFRCVMFRCVMLCVVLLSSSMLENHSKPSRMKLHHKADMILNVLSINTFFFIYIYIFSFF